MRKRKEEAKKGDAVISGSMFGKKERGKVRVLLTLRRFALIKYFLIELHLKSFREKKMLHMGGSPFFFFFPSSFASFQMQYSHIPGYTRIFIVVSSVVLLEIFIRGIVII